jgi:hypothetical protein
MFRLLCVSVCLTVQRLRPRVNFVGATPETIVASAPRRANIASGVRIRITGLRIGTYSITGSIPITFMTRCRASVRRHIVSQLCAVLSLSGFTPAFSAVQRVSEHWKTISSYI